MTDIENDEKHRNDVEFHAEAGGAVPDRKHTTLVGGVLYFRITSLFSKENAESKSDNGKANRDEGLEDDGEIIGKHEEED